MSSVPLMEGAPAPETVIDGVRYLYFGGTGYLGLAAHPEVIEAGCEAMRQYGVHTATTRARIGSPLVVEVERRATMFFETEDAFTFGSGYVANHIMVAALAKEVGAIVVDEAAHYCVLEAAQSSGLPVATFRSRDPQDLARAAQQNPRLLVMADAVSPTTGERAPVSDYLRVLQSSDRALLLLDDAHGIGVLGPQGRGLLEELKLWEHVNGGPPVEGVELFVCGTLAKALGGYGGIIPGTSKFVERARRSSHYFDGSSAPASAVAGASAKALEIVMKTPSLRKTLRENSQHLRAGLRTLGLSVLEGDTAHFGVTIGDAADMQALHRRLKERDILVPYVGEYAGIPPGGLLRFAVFATHTPPQIDRLLDELSILL